VSPARLVDMLMTPLTALAPQIVPPGPRDDLDAVDVVEQDVLDVPVDALEELVVGAAAVDEEQDVFGEGAVEAADAYRPDVAFELGDIEPRDGAAAGRGWWLAPERRMSFLCDELQ